MTASLLLDNLLAWSAQICVLVAVGALAALTLKHPRARLIFWQGVLTIALLLPALEPWRRPSQAEGSVSITTAPVRVISPASRHRIPWRREYLLGLFAAGAALRVLWIAAGLLRLRRHRLASRPLAAPPVPFEREHVRWYLSDTISGPVTFGWLRPSILLPARVNEFPAGLREAIACHELVHVRRHDWLFVIAEEAIRGLLWFHPAVWFCLGQIHLAREQVVDLEVVGLTRDRERYLDALVAVAARKLHPDVAPAPLFLKNRHLAMRVAAILKETSMSKSRLVAIFAAVFSAALVAARLAVWFFPLQSPAQSGPQAAEGRAFAVSDGPGITVEPGAKLMHRLPVFYPRGAKATGTVVIEAMLDSKGEVTDARVLSGPEELRRAALSSVLNWHYSTEASLPPSVQIVIKFDPVPADRPRLEAKSAIRPAPLPLNATLKTIEFSGVTPEVEQKVRDRLPLREGDLISGEMVSRVSAAAREIDEHFAVGMSMNNLPDGRREATLRIYLGGLPAPAPGDRLSLFSPPPAVSGPSLSERPDKAETPRRIRVGGTAQAANLMTKVAPPYPPLAKEARIQGTVRFNVAIGSDGVVQNVELVSGHPLLVPAAAEAVKQWIYRPTLLNGEPVEVITQVDVNFTLRGEQ